MFVKSLRSILALVIMLALLGACGPAASTPAPAEQEEPAAEQPAATEEAAVEAPAATEEAAAEAPAATEEAAVEEAPADSDALQVWVAWGDNPAQLQELFNKYGEANNVKVQVNAPVPEDKIIAGLSGSQPPDILVMGAPDYIPGWTNEGLLTPLNEVIAANNIEKDDIIPAVLSQCAYKDDHYCLPWGTDTYALYWNKDLFEEAGLDPEKPPQTLEELAEYADKLTKMDDNGEITQIGFIPDFSWTHYEQYIPMFGGFWVSDDGTKVQLDSQPVIDSLKWEQQFYSKYGADKVLKFTSSLGEYGSPQHGFMDSKVAMMVDGEWMTGPNFIQGLKPDLFYGVAPLPPPADHPERAGSNTVQGSVAVIPSGAKDKAAAGKLLAWMMSPEIVAEEMFANFNLPSSGKAGEDPRFQENEKFKVFLELSKSPNTRSIVLNSVHTDLLKELGRIHEQVVHGGEDPEPLLKEMQAKLQADLDKALSE
jgi:multiple sugar transport system substrate-binding protein